MFVEFNGTGKDKHLVNTDHIVAIDRIYGGKESLIYFSDKNELYVKDSYASVKWKLLYYKDCPYAKNVDSGERIDFETIEDYREWIAKNKDKYVIKVIKDYYCTYWLPRDNQKPHASMP